jgi:CHAT domain-containing protein
MGEPLKPASASVVRPRRQRIWRLIILLIPALTFAGVAALVLKFFVFSEKELDCETASRAMSPGNAVLICQREYQRTRRPLTGTYLADVLRRSGNLAAASGIAGELLSTDVRGDAQQILAKIAAAENRIDDAIASLQDARRWHRERGNHVELARDDQALAEIQTKAKQFVEALQSLDECISESRAGADKLTEGYCHLSAARALMRTGYFEASHKELDRAAPLLSGDRDLALVWHWRGNLEQEVVHDPRRSNHNALAVVAFERAFELATRAQLTSLLLNLHMNLAYSLAEVGRFDEADHHLQEAGVLDSGGSYASQRAQLAARIAYRQGNLSLAFSLNERLFPKIDDEDEKIDVSVMQARIALALHDPAAAVMWARRGVESAEKIRAATTLGELRPWVLASRRGPFEALFTALARAGQVDDAIVVFDRWQGRTLLDEMARPSPEPSPALSATATTIQKLGQWLPAVSSAPLMTSDKRAVIQALREIDLVAFAVAQDEHEKREVWRLTSSHGQFRIDRIGMLEALRDRLDRFTATPTDLAIADELGALLLPEDVVRKTDAPLYVVLDSPLAALPVVALRRANQPLIAMRPVIRSPRLPLIGACEPRTGHGGVLVLADAAGDLPDARRESSKVASMFGTTPLVGAAATSTALFAAKSDPLLHVAVHADVEAGGGVLKLHDRTVSAPEISASKLGPQLVVLSACSTARSWDPEQAGSLSTAFLAGGSDKVIATLRPVSDAGALELTSRFYDARGADDPVRTLAKIQAALAQTANKEWPNFAVFGKEVCSSKS